MEKETKYAKFIFDKEDQELVNILEEYIEIRIISTKKEYDEINKKRRNVDSIPDWSIGNYHDNTIEYVSFNDYQNTRHKYPIDKYDEYLEYYKKTIIHEFTHYVLKLYIEKYNNSNPLKYLNEGIAQYLSGQRDNQKLKLDFSLDDILNSNSNYPAWYLMTKYILDNYGRKYFLKLIIDNKLAEEVTPKLYEEAKEYYSEG